MGVARDDAVAVGHLRAAREGVVLEGRQRRGTIGRDRSQPVELVISLLDVEAIGIGDLGDIAVVVQLVADRLALRVGLGDAAPGGVVAVGEVASRGVGFSMRLVLMVAMAARISDRPDSALQ